MTLPNAHITFPECGYSAAVTDYFAAREWIQSCGIRYRTDIDTDIVTFLKGKLMRAGIPPGYKNVTSGWQVAIELRFNTDLVDPIRKYLRSLTLPRNSTLLLV